MRVYLEYNFRKVEKVEMINLLDSMEDDYMTNLKASADAYEDYHNVSEETYNDYRVAIGKIEILHEIGLITPAECKDLCEEANAMRLKFLNKYTNKEEK